MEPANACAQIESLRKQAEGRDAKNVELEKELAEASRRHRNLKEYVREQVQGREARKADAHDSGLRVLHLADLGLCESSS